MKKPSIGIIFLTVFIDLVGFGLILPLIPVFSKNFGAKGWMIGGIMASYSLMQFIFSPIWGRLSDRIGRRPILLASTACACGSYVLLAIGLGMAGSKALWVILGSRLVAGICGANITVAQAYIADITPPEKRSARMGLIGMAFGLGFIFGPALGAVSIHYFGLAGTGWTAAALCALNFISALIILRESWKPAEHYVQQRAHFAQFMHTLRHPALGLLIGIFFLATFAFTCFETTIGLLVSKVFSLDLTLDKNVQTVAWLIVYCGLLGALVQGGLTGRLVKKMGEPKLISVSLILAAIGIGAMPYSKTWAVLLIGLGIFSIGSSLTRPPVFGMISLLTLPTEQGATMGVAQGIGSIARIVGPLFAASLFDVHPALPYLVCAAVLLLTGLFASQYLKKAEPIHA